MSRGAVLGAALLWALLLNAAALAEQRAGHPLLRPEPRGLRELVRVAAGATCPMGSKPCSGMGCVDPKTDPANCGGCSRACDAGIACKKGKCQCPRGRVRCAESNPSAEGTIIKCRNIRSDRNNCGKCKKVCATGARCMMGRCVCPKGTKRVKCPNPFDPMQPGEYRCLNLKKDPKNCGVCGNVCPGKCVNGTCACSLPGFTQCGPACTNLKTDPLNCGSCKSSCNQRPTPEDEDWCCNGQCPNNNNCGKCGRKCGANEECCFSICGADGLSCHQCTDLSSDPGNCGTCGNICIGGTGNCVMGKCQ